MQEVTSIEDRFKETHRIQGIRSGVLVVISAFSAARRRRVIAHGIERKKQVSLKGFRSFGGVLI
jgi:hypothetical protein